MVDRKAELKRLKELKQEKKRQKEIDELKEELEPSVGGFLKKLIKKL